MICHLSPKFLSLEQKERKEISSSLSKQISNQSRKFRSAPHFIHSFSLWANVSKSSFSLAWKWGCEDVSREKKMERAGLLEKGCGTWVLLPFLPPSCYDFVKRTVVKWSTRCHTVSCSSTTDDRRKLGKRGLWPTGPGAGTQHALRGYTGRSRHRAEKEFGEAGPGPHSFIRIWRWSALGFPG